MMLRIYTRDQGEEQLTPNLKAKEFFCKCGKCNNQLINLSLVDKIQLIRHITNKPVIINSAYRCENYNKEIGGSENSQHCKGNAADLRGDYSSEAQRINFGGIGLYDTFTHIDIRENGPARWDERS